MMLDEKIVNTLQKMGLTYYGAKAYAALVTMGPSQASGIAGESGVPRSKIYEVLRRLEEEGWVTVEHGRPLVYRPKRPREAIEEHRAAVEADIDFTAAELSSVYDRQVDREAPKVWTIRGMSNIAQRIEDMMSRARHDLVMLGALYSEEEIRRIMKYVVSAKKRGVNVRIITRPSIDLKEGTIDLVEAFDRVLSDVRLYRTPFIKFVVVDGREILIMFSKVVDDVADADSAVAIWTPNAEVASLMQSNFNMMWELADKVGQGKEKGKK
ncbi:MAG TPA: helix-turn-helix domain-containing protein [Methanocella sp.]|jgi:sugar-specific transcriptional regulator TrmB